MTDLAREQRLQIMLTEEELSALDDWRFERRMPTRAAAVRELLKRGLASEGFLHALAGERSQDFGVVTGGRNLPANGKHSNGDGSIDGSGA